MFLQVIIYIYSFLFWRGAKSLLYLRFTIRFTKNSLTDIDLGIILVRKTPLGLSKFKDGIAATQNNSKNILIKYVEAISAHINIKVLVGRKAMSVRRFNVRLIPAIIAKQRILCNKWTCFWLASDTVYAYDSSIKNEECISQCENSMIIFYILRHVYFGNMGKNFKYYELWITFSMQQFWKEHEKLWKIAKKFYMYNHRLFWKLFT